MCGVFGYVSFDGKGPSIKRLEKIAAVTERRGRHAFGFAWVDSKGRIKSFKATGKITDHLSLLSLAHDAQFLIGHCRWATHGSADNNLNNHPFPVDGGWFVHNGVIADHRQIVKDNDLHPVTDCDSETLGLLIEAGEGRLKTRCIEAIQYASGSPLVFLGVWSRPGRLIALRSGNPLSVGYCKGRAYLASLQEELPGKVIQIADNHGIDFSGGKMHEIKFARNSAGCSGPADDSDDDAEPDPLEWDLDDEPVDNDPRPIVREETVEEWKARHDADAAAIAAAARKRSEAKPKGESPYAAIAEVAKVTQQQLVAMDRAENKETLVALKNGTAQLAKSGKVKFTPDQIERLNRGFERNLARLTAKPNGLVPIPGSATVQKQPKKPAAPKLKQRPLDGGLGQRQLWPE